MNDYKGYVYGLIATILQRPGVDRYVLAPIRRPFWLADAIGQGYFCLLHKMCILSYPIFFLYTQLASLGIQSKCFFLGNLFKPHEPHVFE